MKAHTSLKTKLLLFIGLFFISLASQAGYFGVAQNFNSSATFNDQDDGFRVDSGSNVTPWLDLEWSYIDYGTSRFDDPNFVLGDDDDEDDKDRFENIGYGEDSVNEQTARFKGLSSIRTQGVSAGLKFKKSVNNWMQIYARASFLAWHSKNTNVTIFAPRPGFDSDGNELPDGSTDTPNNLNDCGTITYCRIEDSKSPKDKWAVDFWYGYGAIFKPYNWLAIRAEYSIVTLNAVEFPKGKLEGFSTGFEIHF
ncbi:hypothetical protein ACU6U9_18620 [Pseudomonas sp. HK3]